MAKRIADDFWAYVQVGAPDACWPWLRARYPRGYGFIRVRGKGIGTHRYAYELVNGPIPAGLYVLHSCDNPPCCNPSHLRAGTPADNNADMVNRGRARGLVSHGETNPASKLTADQVRAIREEYAAGGVSQRALAQHYHVNQRVIWYIVRHKYWKGL